METFFFGGEEQLFGAYLPPAFVGSAEERTLIFCPWGQDYPRSHRTLIYLARELATKGQHVMVFDYYGTGDSLGDNEDLTFESAVRDVAIAVEEFADIAGDSPLNLIGLRMGANVALETARETDAARLVLWDPILTGAGYLETMEGMQHDMCKDPYRFRSTRQTPAGELLGFRFSDTCRAQLRDLKFEDQLNALSDRHCPTSLIRPLFWPQPEAFSDEHPKLDHVKPAAYDHWDQLDRLELAINPGEETRHILARISS